MADNIIYELGGKPRPHLNRKMRIVLFLNTIPLVSSLAGGGNS